MEVHHHAHHGGKKNWKSYIWEFLMLFLAVFCGFLAEWRLEHMIENHREEEYIHSMVEDINADIEQTTKLLTDVNNRISMTDSLLAALSSEDIKEHSDKAYGLWLTTIGFPDFIQNDRTIQQLKGSGALRLIRNKAVSDKIMEYDQAVRLLSVTQNNMNAIAANTTLFNQTFDFINLSKKTGQPVPLTENGKRSLNEAYANRSFWKFNLTGLRQRLLNLNKKGTEVAEFIKKQYHLE
ncbi:MAG: hypothetical protein QM791_12315 [Ferruginibacter sp.]